MWPPCLGSGDGSPLQTVDCASPRTQPGQLGFPAAEVGVHSPPGAPTLGAHPPGPREEHWAQRAGGPGEVPGGRRP